MKTYKLSLKRRKTGKAGKKQLADDDLRGVVYGPGIESVPLVGDYQTVRKILSQAGTSHIIKLDVDDGEAMDVLVKDLDHEPVSNRLRHFDLLALRKGEKIDVEVPIELKGEAPAIKLGHIVHQLIYELEVRTLPANIPESFDVDVTALTEIGDTIYVKDLDINSEDVEIDEGLLEQPVVKIDEVRELEVEDTTEELSADDVPSEHGEEGEEGEEGEAEQEDGGESGEDDKPESEGEGSKEPKE